MRLSSGLKVWWAFVVCLWVFGVMLVLPAVGWCAESLVSVSSGGGLLSGSPLVVAGEESLVGSESAEAEAVKRTRPEAVVARGVSSAAYEGLDSQAAEGVANEAFGSRITEPAGLLRLTPGQKVLSYVSANAASLELPGGVRGVAYSQSPIAVEGSSGQVVPVDLSLTETVGGFGPRVPAAGGGVRIPKGLSAGPVVSGRGVGVTPVDEQGAVLGGGDGVVDGASVFYGDTEAPDVTDVDTVVKPEVSGFSTETILRSERSPERLFFKVSLPEGAALVVERPGVVDVVDAGQVISSILPVDAWDAEGTKVPVSMSVSGDTLELEVKHRPGEYRMPIEVDPTVSEGQDMGRYQMGRNWWFYADSPGNVFTNYEPKNGSYGMEDHDPYNIHYKAGEYGIFGFEGRGESRIDEFVSESYDKNPSTISNTVYIYGPGGLESNITTPEWTPTTVCVTEGCSAPVGSSSHWANGAFYSQTAVAEEWQPFEDLLRSSTVYITQEKGPSANLGSCGTGWTKSSSCSIEMIASDPGLGVSEYNVKAPGTLGWGKEEKYSCEGGVWCSAQVTANLSLTGLPEGEDIVKATVKDPAGLGGATERAVKIDNIAPHNITLTGLPASKEIGAGEYKLKAEAMDGEGSTRSAGVMSLALYIDGKLIGSPSGSCTPGPCSAHGEWAIVGREYATGHHTITVVASDNAGNTSSEQFTMIVRSASPVAVGPGVVNPQSGEFALNATDVSMGDGLSVSRSYTSRHLMTGAEGPLSNQWGLALGGEETLSKQANGGMVLTDSSGAQTIFASDGKGGFVSPAGDSNFTLSSTLCKAGQTEYMLRDATSATTTCFKSPSGASGEVMVPSISEGPVATDTVTYTYQKSKGAEYSVPKSSRPDQIITGPDGNLWFTESGTNKISKSTTAGVITEYSLPASSEPAGITVGPDGNVWFTAEGTSKIGKITTSGVVTEYSLPAESWPLYITKGPDGNLWFTEWYHNKIGKITTSGAITEYSLPAGSWPGSITAGSDGNLWFVNKESGKIGKITTSGSITEYTPPSGSYPNSITAGPDSNLWFTEPGMDKVGKMATSGVITQYSVGSSGEGEITTGSDNNLWFTMGERLGRMSTSGVLTEYVARTGGETDGITTGPDGNVWYTETQAEKIGMMPTLGSVIEPTEALAPVPAGVSCSPELKPGCRALTFNYASGTTATGENSSEWGDYSGHLTRIYYTAYDSVSKAMKTVEVAHYLYDKQARLRAEWDPRISPALKITYGYDTEGHVTALTPHGQESWAFSYGTIASDAGPGRLLKANQATASTALWSGNALKNTEIPKLSGEAFVGTRMTVSNGGWSEGPVLYGYQWEDCNSSGKECVAIRGATNANYMPVSGDEGHTLVVQVIATNGSGSLTIASAASTLVKSGHGTEGALAGAQPGTTVEYGVPLSGTGLPTMTSTEVEKWGQKDLPTEATAIFPPDEPQTWPAGDYKRATIYYRDATNRNVNIESPGGGISTSEYNEQNDITRSLSADNRATSLKEGSKSAEASRTLDTQSTYSSEGTELLSTLGPQHTIKLANGTEVQGRSHTAYSYDENAPSEGGPYDLVTKMTQGVQVSGKEEEVRTTRTYYSGQNGLGWKLRKATSVIVDPSGLDLTHTTVYNAATGAVVETKMPEGTAETVYPPSFSFSIGSEGSEPGKFNHPESVALDTSGNLWVVDKVNDRIEKFSPTGTFLAAYGSKGTGNLQFSEPWGIAISSTTGNVFVTDQGNNRVEELNSKGEYVRSFGTSGAGNGQFKAPSGVAIDSNGDVWVSDEGNNRVQEFSETGEYKSQFGTSGTGEGQFKAPVDIAISEGELYVADSGNNRVVEFSPTGTYLGQIGTSGKGPGQFSEPKGIAANPTDGDLYVTDFNEGRIQEFTPAGKFLTQWETWSKTHEVANPVGIAIDGTGTLYITDRYAGKLTAWTLPEAGGAQLNYAATFGTAGTGEGQFEHPYSAAIDGEGDLWVTDHSNNRIEKFTTQGKVLASYGTMGTGNLQFKGPWDVAINKSTGNVYVSDGENNRIEELSSTGTFVRTFGTTGSGALELPKGVAIDSSGNVWVADFGHNRIVEFSATGEYMAAYGTYGSGEKQFKSPADIVYSSGDVYVSDVGDDRIEELSTSGAYIRSFGLEGSGSGEFYGPFGITTDSAGNIYVVDQGNDRVEEFSPTGSFLASFGSKGSGEAQLNEPTSLTVSSAGDVYIVDTANNRVEHWTPADRAAHDTKTIYYTAGEEAEASSCQKHPEWAMLPCITEPAAQPETPGLPPLPVTTTTYNMYQEPLVIASTSGTATRTTTNTYEESGRLSTTETTSTTGTSLPKVTDKYSTTLGVLIEQSTSSLSIKGAFNTLGELTSYTDANGNVSTYEYEKEKDARLTKTNDGKGTQTLVYDETTGLVKELIDSSAGTFTASYDTEGNLTSEGYPNGMTAKYTLNSVGERVGLVYKKETHCTEKCEWYVDNVLPSAHGQWLAQTTSLNKDNYTYDAAGRLIESQNTPTGSGGCLTRRYTYDEDTNRTSIATYQPNTKNECATETGTIERHSYDPADRLIDQGATYEPFGNTTSLPGSDAGGSELTSSFYADDQLASQTQAGETIGYNLDPAGRTNEINSTGKTVASETQHYTGPGDTPAWTGETSGNWKRMISTMSGLSAIEHNGETPVLQLTNLHGDIVATAKDSETATNLETTIKEASDYGVPATENPPKYSWLGSHEIATQLPSGITEMGVRSYVPQLGRFLQPDPRPEGSANAYTYVFGDPINSQDLTGEYGTGPSAWAIAGANQLAGQAVASYEAALRAEAERKAREAAEAARAYAAMQGGSPEGENYQEEGPEEEEYWEEESEYENVAYHPSGEEEAERDASFGPGPVMVAVATHESQVGEEGEGSGEGQSDPAPEVKCGGGAGDKRALTASSGAGRREDVGQCLKQKHYVQGRKWHVQRLWSGYAVRGRGQIRYEHGMEGCLVGAIGGAVFAGFSTAGLAEPTGAIAGCAIGAAVVELFE